MDLLDFGDFFVDLLLFVGVLFFVGCGVVMWVVFFLLFVKSNMEYML